MSAFQVLSDPTRLGIVEALRHGERAVNEIVDAVAIHQSGVSRHLRILQESGFVNVRPAGPQRFYSLRAEPFVELEGWLVGYRALWEARLDRFAAALARKQMSRIREPASRDPRGPKGKKKKT